MGLIEGWLQAEPMLSSRVLMDRLIAHDPERYSERQMRTLQRRLRSHRLQRIEAEMAMAEAGEPRPDAAGPRAASEAGSRLVGAGPDTDAWGLR